MEYQTNQNARIEQEGVFSFRKGNGSNLVLSMLGSFAIPPEFQDLNGELSVEKVHKAMTREGRARMTHYTNSQSWEMGPNGEKYLHENISMTWRRT